MKTIKLLTLSRYSINELFKMRDACAMLETFGLHDHAVYQAVKNEIKERADEG